MKPDNHLRITIRLTEELRKKIRIAAAYQDMSMTEWMISVIEKTLNNEPEKLNG